MNRIYAACIIIPLFTSCIERRSYYLSPQNANSSPYHAIPMKGDSLKSAIYASTVFTSGYANVQSSDHLFAFQGSVHRSNNFGFFQAYYGANLSLGSYHVSDYYNIYNLGYNYPYFQDTLNHIPNSNNFFGSYGVSAGINIVTTNQHVKKYKHSEWRILGLETSLQNEFGAYSDFRDKLSDTAASIIFRKHFSAYMGLYSEWLWTNKDQFEFGVKMGFGTDLNPGSSYTNYYGPSILPLRCFSIAWHVKKDHFTGFIQTNFGSYATNIQWGLSYRLGKK
jgi:hypothetical protein